MLGIRIDEVLERRLAQVASQQGRTKSEVARDAVRKYVDRYDAAYRAEARRQSLRAAERDNPADWGFAEAIEAEDGGWR